MQLRTRGWAGLVVMTGGLALVGASMIAAHRTETGRPAPTALAAAPPASAKPAHQPDTQPPASQPFIIKRILPINGPIRYGDWHWDEAGVPDGPLVVTVDLQARVLSVFRDGYEIATTAVLLGTTEKPTPTGLFPITEKDADHRSNIYDGAPMPYMMRLTTDGVTIHGTKVENGYASHGCVGVPTPFARKLFDIAKLGTPVYITRGKMIDMGDSLVG